MSTITYIGMDVHTTNYTLCCYTIEEDKAFAVVQVEPKYTEILKYIEKIKKHNVLRGQYIRLDSASQYLDGDWKSNFRIQAGRYLESLGVTDDSQICSGVEVMVARMEGNTFAPILFKMLVEYANTISTAYKNAIEFFYNQETQMIIFNEGMDFYTAEQKLLNLDALKAELLLSLVKAYPCGLIADTDKTDWMIRKEGTIKRVDFTELFDVVSFEPM